MDIIFHNNNSAPEERALTDKYINEIKELNLIYDKIRESLDGKTPLFDHKTYNKLLNHYVKFIDIFQKLSNNFVSSINNPIQDLCELYIMKAPQHMLNLQKRIDRGEFFASFLDLNFAPQHYTLQHIVDTIYLLLHKQQEYETNYRKRLTFVFAIKHSKYFQNHRIPKGVLSTLLPFVTTTKINTQDVRNICLYRRYVEFSRLLQNPENRKNPWAKHLCDILWQDINVIEFVSNRLLPKINKLAIPFFNAITEINRSSYIMKLTIEFCHWYNNLYNKIDKTQIPHQKILKNNMDPQITKQLQEYYERHISDDGATLDIKEFCDSIEPLVLEWIIPQNPQSNMVFEAIIFLITERSTLVK